MSKLSVVLPAYNEELMVGKTCRVLAEVLTKAEIPYELVVVNDGSGDRTWEEIQKANTMFMALELEPGSHEIRLTYCIPDLRAGRELTVAGL